MSRESLLKMINKSIEDSKKFSNTIDTPSKKEKVRKLILDYQEKSSFLVRKSNASDRFCYHLTRIKSSGKTLVHKK